MAKRSRCLLCGQLTNTRRYVQLRWKIAGTDVQAPYWTRRICDQCAEPIKRYKGRELVAVIQCVKQAKPEPDVNWSEELYDYY